MKKIVGLLALLLLFSGAEAIAQSGATNSPPIGQTIHGGIPQAPIGHRQPNDAMSKEDAALNKKIKSICRGC
jgi:hypothetical protein